MATYDVKFFETSVLSTEDHEVPRVFVHGEIENVKTGNHIEFDFVPLTLEVDFCDDWDEEHDEFWDQIAFIRAMAFRQNHRAYYSYEGVPLKALEIMNSYGKTTYSCFNELDGNFTMDGEMLVDAELIDLPTYQKKMADYAERSF